MQDKLFALISSLSKQEKRYFKLFAEANRRSGNYIKLFHAMNKQKIYDEKTLIMKFKNEKFIKQLHVTKNHLYRLILKSLHAYHSGMSAEARIKELLHFIEILYRKGLYYQCEKILEQAEKIAKSSESHISLIEIVEWRSKIAFAVTKVSELEKYVFDGYHKETEILNILKNKSDFRKLFYEILILNNKGTPVRTADDLKKYKRITINSLLKREQYASSFHAKIMYNYIYAYFLLNKGDVQRSNVYNKRVVALMEENSEQIKEAPVNYVAALNNMIYAGIQLKEFDNCKNTIRKMRDIVEKYEIPGDLSRDLEEKIFIRSHYLELDVYKEAGEFEKALVLIGKIKNRKELQKKGGINRYDLFLYYTIALIYFCTGKYSDALHWVNIIINISETKEPADIFCFTRILNLLIHYELKNTHTIDSIYNSNIRFIKKQKRFFKSEKLFYDFFKQKMLKETSIKKLTNDFTVLKNKLLTVTVSPHEKKAFQYFNYILWIDSKILNTSMAKAMKEIDKT